MFPTASGIVIRGGIDPLVGDRGALSLLHPTTSMPTLLREKHVIVPLPLICAPPLGTTGLHPSVRSTDVTWERQNPTNGNFSGNATLRRLDLAPERPTRTRDHAVPAGCLDRFECEGSGGPHGASPRCNFVACRQGRAWASGASRSSSFLTHRHPSGQIRPNVHLVVTSSVPA